MSLRTWKLIEPGWGLKVMPSFCRGPLGDDAERSGDDGGVAIDVEDLSGFVDAVVSCEGSRIRCRSCSVPFFVQERLVNRESEAIDIRHG